MGRNESFDVHYGGQDSYEVYVGASMQAQFVERGARLDRLPDVDSNGAAIYWIGPVEVRHE